MVVSALLTNFESYCLRFNITGILVDAYLRITNDQKPNSYNQGLAPAIAEEKPYSIFEIS